MTNEKTVAASMSVSRRITATAYRATRDGGAPYEGAYEISPAFESQTLPTKGKSMTDDVTVEAIKVSRTTNASGGKTVYIG
ncbi:MAG: hypothetical protein IJ766_01155 [Clostridia bacterium]|nr:hypothetical protein [Clostridia bacterium]